MAIAKGKCIVPHKNHIGPSLYCAWAALLILCFKVKRHESQANVILILSFGFSSDHKETTETHSDLNRSPQH
jgi:hypothetical protein